MRTFVAIPLPLSLRPAVSALISRLKRSGADIKWVEEENLHVTLRFLGEVAQADLSSLQEALQTLELSPVFPARLGGVGAFPNPRSPRVVWVGFQQGGMQMDQLARALGQELRRRGFPPESKPFHAHLTLGRQRTPHNLHGLVDLLIGTPTLTEPSFSVRDVVLFSSTLTPQGPIYQMIQTVPLKEDKVEH